MAVPQGLFPCNLLADFWFLVRDGLYTHSYMSYVWWCLSSVLGKVNETSTKARLAPGFAVQVYRDSPTVQLYSKITGPSIMRVPQILTNLHFSSQVVQNKCTELLVLLPPLRGISVISMKDDQNSQIKCAQALLGFTHGARCDNLVSNLN